MNQDSASWLAHAASDATPGGLLPCDLSGRERGRNRERAQTPILICHGLARAVVVDVARHVQQGNDRQNVF